MTQALITVIHGSDSWQRRQALRQACQHADGTPVTKDLCPDGAAALLCELLCTPPLFAPERVVLVENAERLLSWTPEQLAQLERAQAALPEGTRVVYLAGKDLGRSVAAKRMSSWGSVKNCAPLSEWQHGQAEQELSQWARNQGKQLTAPAAQLLIAFFGPQREWLFSELEKTLVYIGERKQILPGDIAAVSMSQHIQPFAMSNALSEGRRPLFFKELQRRLEHEHPLPLLGLLAGQFRLFLQLWALRGSNSEDIAKQLGKTPYVIDKNLPALRHWSSQRCQNALGLLHASDLHLKTGVSEPEAYFFMQCVRIWN
jgi:DNA polymerase III delta subunit